VILTHK